MRNVTPTMKRIYDLIVENEELTYEQIIEKSKASEQSIRNAIAGLRLKKLILTKKNIQDARKTIYYPNTKLLLSDI